MRKKTSLATTSVKTHKETYDTHWTLEQCYYYCSIQNEFHALPPTLNTFACANSVNKYDQIFATVNHTCKFIYDLADNKEKEEIKNQRDEMDNEGWKSPSDEDSCEMITVREKVERGTIPDWVK